MPFRRYHYEVPRSKGKSGISQRADNRFHCCVFIFIILLFAMTQISWVGQFWTRGWHIVVPLLIGNCSLKFVLPLPQKSFDFSHSLSLSLCEQSQTYSKVRPKSSISLWIVSIRSFYSCKLLVVSFCSPYLGNFLTAGRSQKSLLCVQRIAVEAGCHSIQIVTNVNVSVSHLFLVSIDWLSTSASDLLP